jgi:hypothetical protein
METNESASSSAVPIPPLEQSAAFLREVIASQTALSPEQLQHLLSLVETGGAALTAQVGALQVAGDNLLAEQAARELQLAQHIHQAAQQATQQAMQQATQQAMQQAAQQASPPTGSKIRPSDCPTFDGNGRNVSQYATDIAVFHTIHGTYFSGNEVATIRSPAIDLDPAFSPDGRSLYYSSAIGTERLLADVILDQVADFDKLHAIPVS